MNYIRVDFGEDEGRVIREANLAFAHRLHGGRACSVKAVAGLLWRRIYHLPAPVAWGKVGPRHPAIRPHVEVPYRIRVDVRYCFAVLVEELVNSETVVGVVSGDEISHGARGNAQSLADGGR